jgi:putative mRNA 3-end processing factor
LLEFNSNGLYCSKGQFYIDPWKPVDKAFITHAHSDHACWGHQTYLAHHHSLPILKYRYGKSQSQFYGVDYNDPFSINGVKVSFHPAGHMIGSSQIRLESKGQVWVCSGDYKLERDGISEPFTPIKCDVFITESTFGLPCFNWEPQPLIFDQIHAWWRLNRAQGLTSVLLGYAVGKAQRLLMGLDPTMGPIFVHGSIWNVTEALRSVYPSFPQLIKLSSSISKQELIGSMVLAPPSAAHTPWMNRFHPYRLGYVSGWMCLRGIRRRYGVDSGFVLSDHADWPALQQAVAATGAKSIIVTHGFTAPFARWLNEQGYEAQEACAAEGGEREEQLEKDETHE